MTEHVDDPELEAELERMREAVLLGTLQNVPFEGWTRKAMEQGAEAAGLSRNEAHMAFPEGLGELARYWSRWADGRMAAAMHEMDTSEMGVREKIATAVRQRIMVNGGHREALKRCLSWLALPMNARIAARNTACTVDAVWRAAGDTSTDWNYYTKRGLLAPVYTTTVLYWLADEPDENGDYGATWDYLRRRLDNVVRVFGMPKRLRSRLDPRRAGVFGRAARRRSPAHG